MSAIIQAEMPNKILEQSQNLVQQELASNLQENFTESFIQDDVEWGLHGDN
jgi:hypothetical protein